MVSRLRNVRGQGLQLKAELISAAIRLLLNPDVKDSFSMRSVAKEANVSAPSVYLHFKDKNDLNLSVMERIIKEQDEIRSAAEENAGEDPWHKLLAGELAHVKFALERTGHYHIIYDGRLLSQLTDPKTASFGKPILLRMVELITQIMSEIPKERVSDDPYRLALLLWSGTHGIVSLILNKPTLDWPEAAILTKQMAIAIIQPFPSK